MTATTSRPDNDDVVGIVLAGGRSERLTTLGLGAAGKAGLVVDGVPCLVRVCRAIAAVVPRVIVVAAANQPLPPLEGRVTIVRDTTPQAGPLAALRDGLAAAAALTPPPRFAFVASCDVPFLETSVVRMLIETTRSSAARFVVPVVGGHPQVLAAVIAVDLAGPIASFAAAGRGPRALLDDLGGRSPTAVRLVTEGELVAVDHELVSFCDLDTPEDLVRLESRGIPPSGG